MSSAEATSATSETAVLVKPPRKRRATIPKTMNPTTSPPTTPGTPSTTDTTVTTATSDKKVKSYRCRHCPEFTASSKNAYSDHQRQLHIDPERLLECPLRDSNCRFVTKYKHHLDYHIRNHSGNKPFECPDRECTYTCVNKSMLNSHMKSHSSFHQHSCQCGFQTKYLHSLKLHISKAPGHEAVSRKMRTISMAHETPAGLQQGAPPATQFPTQVAPLATADSLPVVARNKRGGRLRKSPANPARKKLPLRKLLVRGDQRVTVASPRAYEGSEGYEGYEGYEGINSSSDHSGQEFAIGSLDCGSDNRGEEPGATGVPLAAKTTRHRRKGPAFKLDLAVRRRLQEAFLEDDEDDITETYRGDPRNPMNPGNDSVISVQSAEQNQFDSVQFEDTKSIRFEESEKDVVKLGGDRRELFCGYCAIAFEDRVMFELHMGFHSSSDHPFTCALCGMASRDRLSHFLHVAQAPHY